MASTLVFVTRGPQAGTFLEMTYAEASTAEAEGWGQDARRKGAYDFDTPVIGPNPKAEAFLDRRAGYADREMRPAKAEKAPPARAAAEDEEKAEGAPKAAHGRPSKKPA